MQEKDNVLRILEETKKALKEENSVLLKELSNQTIHTASITQDPDNIAIAIFVYSLSKVVERKIYQQFSGWNNFHNNIISAIDSSINAIKKNDDKKLKGSLTAMRQSLSKVSGKLKEYIQDVFRKASINKASKIYEHGISMETTANLLGITLFELASYSGQKPEIYNAPLSRTLDVKARVKIAEDIFRK